jgi:hypothetical protein
MVLERCCDKYVARSSYVGQCVSVVQRHDCHSYSSSLHCSRLRSGMRRLDNQALCWVLRDLNTSISGAGRPQAL